MRRAPPPDFRYVGLSPGPAQSTLFAGAAGASTAIAGVVLLLTGPDTTSVVGSLLAAGATAIAVGRLGGLRGLRRIGASPTAMAIVPWGVLVHPDAEVRVLRWSGVRDIAVDYVHTRDANGNASTAWSFVTVETSRERLVGRATGPVALERLIAHLEAYAEESSRPVACDLEGEVACEAPQADAVAKELLARARDFLSSGEGAGRLSLEPRSYRGAEQARAVATEETTTRIREAVRSHGKIADPRAFAALLAGEVGAVDLVPELLPLVTAVHPIVAACAKAAALRLGVPPTRAGALREVAPFVLEEDIEALESWVAESNETR